MRVQQFLEQLPGLYEGWGTGEMAPKAGEFGEILGSSAQPTTANFLALARWAAACLEPGEAIAEIGCYEGANLVAMLQDEPECLAYGVDFFSTQPEVAEERMGRLQENLDRFGVLERVCVAHQTVEDFFRELRALGAEDRFGLYLYGFEPDYRQVFLSLLLARQFWADSALVIVRNTESGAARQAVADFLELEPSFRLLLDWRCRGRQVFGAEGLGIFVWDTLGALADWEPLRVVEATPPIQLITSPPEGKKRVLHVGCGPYNPEALPPELRTEEWQEIRLDINPAVNPDILGTITDLGAVPDGSVDAVYSSHNLEHIYDYEVPLALAEFKRVLKPGGLTWLVVPDMQIAAEWVVKGDMDDQPLYQSPAGPVKALWMFYGMGTSIPGIPYMAHKTGFTASGLERRLLEVGFDPVEVSRGNFNVYGKGYKNLFKDQENNLGEMSENTNKLSESSSSSKLLLTKKEWLLQEKLPHYQIGRGTYSHNLIILEESQNSKLQIGHFCSISEGVTIILGGEHNTNWITTYPFNIFNGIENIEGHPASKGDIIIGHDVWIGMNTLILSGVTIGNGAVIGAGSVITKNVPPYTIVAGNPACIIRKRFDESIIDELMQIEWWNWPDETIEASIHLLQSNKIQDFLEFAKSVSHSQ